MKLELFIVVAVAFSPILPALSKTGDRAFAVDIITQEGKCEKSISARFVVRDDEIVSDRASTLTADGSIEKNGEMWVRMNKGRDLYRLQGHIRGTKGSGTWSSNTRLCGGTWRGQQSR